MRDRKPPMTKEERNAARRVKYHEERKKTLADAYYERVRYGGNRILLEDYGKFHRWTWADRTGEWLNEAACQLLIETKRILMLSETAEQKVFGHR
jgi:hypothetical protein